MQYKLYETNEAVEDVTKLAVYMIDKFKNRKAAGDFMNAYDKQVDDLKYFPFGYRGISLEYRGYEIRLKPFGTYNIFFIIDIENKSIVVLRILKDLQNWKTILENQREYHW